jgi:hypothetical protein
MRRKQTKTSVQNNSDIDRITLRMAIVIMGMIVGMGIWVSEKMKLFEAIREVGLFS